MADNSFAGINFSDPNSPAIFKNNEEKMCPKWKDESPSKFSFDIKIDQLDNVYEVNGTLTGNLLIMAKVQNLMLKYWASSPPTYGSDFSGSGMPYPNKTIAFENSPNRGVVNIINGQFKIKLNYPNSYYDNLGTIYVPPQVQFEIYNTNHESVSDVLTIILGEGIPYRTQSWPTQRNWNDGPLFYKNNNLPVRTQFQILCDSAYPKTNNMPANFWGLTPPH